MVLGKSALVALVNIFIILILTACGGGGSQDAPNYIGGSGLSVSSNSIQKTFDQYGTQKSSGVTVSWNSILVTEIVAGMPPGVTKPSWLTLNITGRTSPVNLSIGVDNTNLPIGVYETTVRVVTFNVQTPMDYKDIPVHFEITEKPTVDQATLNFNVIESNTTTPQTINLSRPDSTVTIFPTSFISGFTTWANLSINEESVTVTLNNNALSLAPGEYRSSLEIDYNGGRWSIPIQLNVSSALNVPASITFNIDHTSTPTDKTQDITIASNLPAPINWNAAFSDNWMSLNTASGNTSVTNNLSLTLEQPILDNLLNGSYTGTITVSSADPNVSDVEIPVSLNITMPQVIFISPYQAVSGHSEKVIIRGSGFESLANPVVRFSGTNALTTTVISNTEIHAIHPALLAGQYDISITDDSNITLTSFAKLTVSDPRVYTSTWISNPLVRGHDNLVFDMYLQAVYFRKSTQFEGLSPSSYQGAIYQYLYTGSNWSLAGTATDTALTFGGTALSPSGRTFFAHNIDDHILSVDSTTLIKNSLLATQPGYSSSFKSAAMANNGKMLITSSYSSVASIYSSNVALDGSTTTTRIYINYSDYADRIAKASLDGSRVYFVSNTSPATVRYYDASSDQLNSSNLYLSANNLSVNRTGDRLIIGAEVYDGDFNLLGALPNTQTNTISSDGLTAYTFDSDDTGATFRKFDLTSSDGIGGFTEIGTSTHVSGSLVNAPQMIVSQDEETLFVVGDATFIVQPAP